MCTPARSIWRSWKEHIHWLPTASRPLPLWWLPVESRDLLRTDATTDAKDGADASLGFSDGGLACKAPLLMMDGLLDLDSTITLDRS